MGYTDRKFVLEGWHNLPDYFMPFINKEEFVIVCLGYPNADEEEMFKKIRENDTEHDNTKNTSDEKLKKLIHDSKIEKSKILKQQSIKWGIPFFETDKDRQEQLKNVFKYIKENI